MDKETKKCTSCGEIKPLGSFYALKRSPDGRRSYCKTCSNLKRKAWGSQNKERLRELKRAKYRANPEHAREIRRRWRANNPQKVAESLERSRAKRYWKAWRENNRERNLANDRARRKNNPSYFKEARKREAAHRREYNAKWREANRESWYKVIREWKRNNKIRSAVTQNKRRTNQVNNGGAVTLNDWLKVLQYYDYQCLACRKTGKEVTLSMDHVVPLVKGGRHSPVNLQPLCRSCNSRKKDKVIDYRYGAELMSYWHQLEV